LATSKTETIKYYPKTGLWRLYVATAFPIHVWAIVLILMDISWVAERTNYWDAVGVMGYGLMYILFESLLLFAVAILVGFLLPRSWPFTKRLAVLGTLVLLLQIWAILSQLYFLWDLSFPLGIIRFIAGWSRPLRVLYISLFAIVAPTVVIPQFFALRSQKFQLGFLSLVDRLSTLMVFYVFLDVAGILVVIIRNLGA
jgi:hypothetical protein